MQLSQPGSEEASLAQAAGPQLRTRPGGGLDEGGAVEDAQAPETHQQRLVQLDAPVAAPDHRLHRRPARDLPLDPQLGQQHATIPARSTRAPGGTQVQLPLGVEQAGEAMEGSGAQDFCKQT